MTLPTLQPDLIVTEIEDELLVFEPKSEQAHCLSPQATLVYRACAEGASRDKLTEQLRALSVEQPEEFLDETLAQFADAKLIPEASLPKFDRRRFLAVAGAAAALPIISSVLVPRPAMALSCVDCQLAPGNVPLDCMQCGKPCPSGTCDGTQTCNFEYVVNPPNTGQANPCRTSASNSEASGIFRCRVTAGIFSKRCNDSRLLLGATPTIGQRYYCCFCSGEDPIFTCPDTGP